MASNNFMSLEPQDSTASLVARNKRRNTALSCAECRRLKLRCNRVWPCNNCVKKGCSVLCPDSSLTTGKGNRFVLANTETLHEKIEELSNRVRALEDALAESHGSLAQEPHPLLSEELLLIKRPLERERQHALIPTEEKPETTEAIDAMGSLSISERGRTSFFGQTANSWYLLKNEEGSDEEGQSPGEFDVSSPSDAPWLNYSFPLNLNVSKTAHDIRASLHQFLPPASLVQKLSNIYYRHAAWMYTPMPELEFQECILFRIYNPDSVLGQEPVDLHAVAFLYLAIAIGTLLDPEMPPNSPQAMQYYQLGRTALATESVLEQQSIMAIRALLIMCHFMFLAGIEGPRWVLFGIIVKLAQGVGLHRNSERWKLNPEDSHKRRALMEEVYTYDSWQSLTFGRPPSFSLHHIDTGLPHGTRTGDSGAIEMSFAVWKYRFSSQCLSIVHDRVFGARTPDYKTLMDLDKKVRQFYVPPSLQVPGFGTAKLPAKVEQPTVELTMQRYVGFAIKEITLFYMHRGFFARAMEDNPVDPLTSKYGPSVLAAYNSANSFIVLISSLFSQQPILTERMWFLFTHVFSCAIVLGSIAVKSRVSLAPSALAHLEAARVLFSQVNQNPNAAKVIPILHKLQERARVAISNSSISPRMTTHNLSSTNSEPSSEMDELSALGGKTRLVAKKTSLSNPSTPRSPGPEESFPSSPSSTGTGAHTLTKTPSPQEEHHHVPLVENAWPGYNPMPNFSTYGGFPIPSVSQSQFSTSPYPDPLGLQSVVPFDFMEDFHLPGCDDVTSSAVQDHVHFGMQNRSGVDIAAPDPNTSWLNFLAQFKY